MDTTIARTDDNALVQQIKPLLVRGKSYLDIERLFGIPAARAESIMRKHWQDKAQGSDPTEQRMLQMERLEALIEPLMDMALLGNVKSAEVLIKNLESINTLLGLNLQQTKMEIKIVNDEQSKVIFMIAKMVVDSLLGLVQEQLTGVDDHALALIEDAWDDRVQAAFSTGAARIIEAEVVE